MCACVYVCMCVCICQPVQARAMRSGVTMDPDCLAAVLLVLSLPPSLSDLLPASLSLQGLQGALPRICR